MVKPKSKSKSEEDVPVVDRYDYLSDVVPSDGDGDDGITVPAEFATLWMGQPNTIEIDGVLADRNKFCAEGFPEQNLEKFYLIPLYVNSNRRLMYLHGYDGESSPPDCQSLDGVRPMVPLQYNGMLISNCAACPLFGYSKDYKCRNKPALIGLAYFPEHGNLLVPVRKNIPGMSVKPFNAFVRALTAPVTIGDTPMKIPHWARVVEVSVALEKGRYGIVPTWSFSVLSPTNTREGVPTFVPQPMLEEIRKFYGVAKTYARSDTPSAPALPAGHTVAGALPGSSSPPTPEPVASASVVADEAESDY